MPSVARGERIPSAPVSILLAYPGIGAREYARTGGRAIGKSGEFVAKSRDRGEAAHARAPEAATDRQGVRNPRGHSSAVRIGSTDSALRARTFARAHRRPLATLGGAPDGESVLS